MFRTHLLWIAASACALLVGSAVGAQETGRFEKPIEGFEATVLTIVPKNYTPAKAWGLVVGLHGTGMNGESLAGAFDMKAIHEAGYLTIFPTSHHRAWGTAGSAGTQADKDKAVAYLKAVLETFLEEYSIHPDKIHLVGYSAGSIISAYGTGIRRDWDDIKIRSINCHSGGLGGKSTAKAGRKDEMAVWVLNGSEDRSHDELSRNLCAMFEDAGYDARFTEVPGVGHNFPLIPFKEIIAWWQGLDADAPDLTKILAMLAKARKSLAKKKYRAAYEGFEAARKEADGVSAPLTKEADEGKARIASLAGEMLAEAEAVSNSKPAKAKSLLRKVMRTFKGTPFEQTARDRLEKIE